VSQRRRSAAGLEVAATDGLVRYVAKLTDTSKNPDIAATSVINAGMP
jgi:hypothetical protein